MCVCVPLSCYLHPVWAMGCRSPDGPVGGMYLRYLHSTDLIGPKPYAHASVSLSESLEHLTSGGRGSGVIVIGCGL